jgi:hypothetical protein
MYECDISQYITETNRQFCIEDATKMYTNNYYSKTFHVMGCKQMWLSNLETQLNPLNTLNKEQVTYYAGVVSTHNTPPSPLFNSPNYKNIFLLPVLSSNITKISSRFLLQISLQKQQHIFVLPPTLHHIKHAVYTCKVDSYGAVQLGSSLYVVHECVHMPHLKRITTDHTRMGI